MIELIAVCLALADPFTVDPPVSPEIIENQMFINTDIINTPPITDRIYKNCTFVGLGLNHAFSIRHVPGATWPHPVIERFRFEDCMFIPSFGYAFWCNGDLRNTEFDDCMFGSSASESPVRIYNAFKVQLIDCDLFNEGESVPDNQKACARFINFDLVRLLRCDFIGGALWLNMPDTGGGWGGRVWVEECAFDHWSSVSTAIAIFERQSWPPWGVVPFNVTVYNCTAVSRFPWPLIGGGEHCDRLVDVGNEIVQIE